MSELLVQLDPNVYRKYIQVIKDKPILYVKLQKALYGTLHAAYLFWKRLSDQLMKWGFVLNPYDSCVTSKIIGEKKFTIVWHIDDLKISHQDKKVVDHIINLLELEVRKESPLTNTRGKT